MSFTDVVFIQTSTRCGAASTPSTRPHESLPRRFRDVSVRRRREAKLKQRATEDFCHAPGALKRHFETERDLYDRGLRAARANGLKLLRFSFEAVIVGAPIIRSARRRGGATWQVTG